MRWRPDLLGLPRKLNVFLPTSQRRTPKPAQVPARGAALPTAPEASALRLRGALELRRCGLRVGKLRPGGLWGAGARASSRAASYLRAGGRPRGQLVPGRRLFAGAAPRGLAGLWGAEARGGGQQARVREHQGSGRTAGGGHAGGGSLSPPSAASGTRPPAPRLITRLNPPRRPESAHHRRRPLPAPARAAAAGAGGAVRGGKGELRGGARVRKGGAGSREAVQGRQGARRALAGGGLSAPCCRARFRPSWGPPVPPALCPALLLGGEPGRPFSRPGASLSPPYPARLLRGPRDASSPFSRPRPACWIEHIGARRPSGSLLGVLLPGGGPSLQRQPSPQGWGALRSGMGSSSPAGRTCRGLRGRGWGTEQIYSRGQAPCTEAGALRPGLGGLSPISTWGPGVGWGGAVGRSDPGPHYPQPTRISAGHAAGTGGPGPAGLGSRLLPEKSSPLTLPWAVCSITCASPLHPYRPLRPHPAPTACRGWRSRLSCVPSRGA